MASLKFNHIFVVSVGVCAASAVFLPVSVAEKVRAPVVLLFAPVSTPVHAGSSWLGDKINPEARRLDGNVPVEVVELQNENAQLRLDLASMSAQLEELKRLNEDRAQLGLVRERSVPATVAGLDGGTGGLQQILAVVVPTSAAVKEGMPVVSPQGLVGRVTSSVRGGTRVRLTTDAGAKVQGSFVRFVANERGGVVPQMLGGKKPLVSGTGGGTETGLRIGSLSMADALAVGVAPGDWVVLSDTEDWPQLLQGYKIGKVKSVEKSKLNPLWAEIVVEPPLDFRRLREVMIVNK